MNNNNFPTLRLKRFNSAFIDPATEAAYKAWCVEDRLPAIRIAGFIALAMWSIVNGWCYLAFPEIREAFPDFLLVVYGIVVPGIGLALLGSYIRWLRPAVMLVSAAILTLTGFAITWLQVKITGEPGGAALGAITALIYAPIMRLRANWTLYSCLPFTLFAGWLVVNTQGDSDPSQYIYWIWLLLPGMALFTAFVVNLMADRRDRTNYRNKCIIDLQKNRLEDTQGQIRRYIPPAVAEQIISGNEAVIAEPKRQRVTVLFADIVGFTDIADRVEPEVMTDVLNAYMSTMADLIAQYGGTLNEFAGDGIMALFGAPETMTPEEQARSAIESALAMQAKMPELNESWRKLGLGAELKTRIGINTGMVSVGSYGSQGRMTYTAIGLQTNIASRIETKAEPGQILISDATYQLIHGQIDCEPKGEVECKGVHFPIKVYAPRKQQTV